MPFMYTLIFIYVHQSIHSKASRYAASRSADLGDTRFWIGSQNTWDTRLLTKGLENALFFEKMWPFWIPFWIHFWIPFWIPVWIAFWIPVWIAFWIPFWIKKGIQKVGPMRDSLAVLWAQFYNGLIDVRFSTGIKLLRIKKDRTIF